jgi:hypothetical protein
MAQTSRPERTRSLPNLDLKSRYKYFGVPASFDFGWIRRFEKQLDRFLQVCTSTLDRVALARDIELGTKPNVPLALALNDCGQLLRVFHEYLSLISF